MMVMDFIDSTVIILAFTPNNKKEKCREILEGGGIVNSLILAEAHYNIEKITKDKNLATDAIKSVLNKFEIVALDHNLLFEALRRAEKYNLRIFDLIHYVTALLKGCSSIISHDKHFDGLEIKRKKP